MVIKVLFINFIKLFTFKFTFYLYKYRLLASSKVEVTNEMILKTGNTTIKVDLKEKQIQFEFFQEI